MIGICPHCKIELKKQKNSNRETNEILVVMNYRRKLESGEKLKSVSETGYCEICNATLEDLEIE